MFHKLLKSQATIYVLGELISKLVPFAVLPILSRILTVDDFGFFSLFIVSTFFGYILIGLGSAAYIPIVFFKKKERLGSVIFTSITTAFCMASISSLLLISIYLNASIISKDFLLLLISIIFYGFFFNIFQNYLSILQCQKRASLYVILNLIKGLLYFIGIILLYFLEVSSVFYYILVFIIPVFLISSVMLFILIERFSINFGRSKFDKSTLLFSMPLIPGALSNWAKTSIDRYLIIGVLGTVSLSLYSASFQLGFAITFVSAALSKALAPSIFSSMQNNGLDKGVIKKCAGYALVITIIGIIYALFCFHFTSIILGHKYQGVEVLVIGLVMAGTLQGIASQFVGILHFLGLTKFVLYVNVTTLSFHVLLSLLVSLTYPRLELFVSAVIASTFLYVSTIIVRCYAEYRKTT